MESAESPAWSAEPPIRSAERVPQLRPDSCHQFVYNPFSISQVEFGPSGRLGCRPVGAAPPIHWAAQAIFPDFGLALLHTNFSWPELESDIPMHNLWLLSLDTRMAPWDFNKDAKVGFFLVDCVGA